MRTEDDTPFSAAKPEQTLAAYSANISSLSYHCFTALKWGLVDIIPGFSDLDLRMVVLPKDPDDLVGASYRTYDIYSALIGASVEQARALEHPPRLICYMDLARGLGNPWEISRWHLVAGDPQRFSAIHSTYDCQPFSDGDRKYYQQLILSKESYSLRDETIYGHLGESRFKRYCLAWRYYGTSAYAYACLYSARRYPGKTAGIAALGSAFPDLSYADRNRLLDCVRQESLSPEEFGTHLQDEWRLLKVRSGFPWAQINAPERNAAALFSDTLQRIRNKFPRLRLYLRQEFQCMQHAPTYLDNLIKRELVDLAGIRRDAQAILIGGDASVVPMRALPLHTRAALVAYLGEIEGASPTWGYLKRVCDSTEKALPHLEKFYFSLCHE